MDYTYNYSQEKLDYLCKDRSLETDEIHQPNDYYGQANVIKEYVGLPQSYSLKAVLEHSLFLDDWMWDADNKVELPMIFSGSLHRAEIHKKYSTKESVPIGYGLLYAIENFNKKYGKESVRNGTIAFPVHSTHHIKAVFDYESYAKYLVNLPERFQPVTVCIYWKDFIHEAHKIYKNVGLNVVSAGHIYDKNFLYHFYDICRQFKYSTSNAIGGSCFLSVASGCNYFYFQPSEIVQINQDNYPIGGGTNLFQEIESEFIRLFSKCEDEITNEQLEFVYKFVGNKDFKSKGQLVKLIVLSEVYDKFLIVITGTLKQFLPCFFQRNVLLMKLFNFINKKIISIK